MVLVLVLVRGPSVPVRGLLVLATPDRQLLLLTPRTPRDLAPVPLALVVPRRPSLRVWSLRLPSLLHLSSLHLSSLSRRVLLALVLVLPVPVVPDRLLLLATPRDLALHPLVLVLLLVLMAPDRLLLLPTPKDLALRPLVLLLVLVLVLPPEPVRSRPPLLPLPLPPPPRHPPKHLPLELPGLPGPPEFPGLRSLLCLLPRQAPELCPLPRELALEPLVPPELPPSRLLLFPPRGLALLAPLVPLLLVSVLVLLEPLELPGLVLQLHLLLRVLPLRVPRPPKVLLPRALLPRRVPPTRVLLSSTLLRTELPNLWRLPSL